MKNLQLLLIALLSLFVFKAQSQNIEEIFGNRGEIYFQFNKNNLDLNKLSRIVSLDKVDGEWVNAYANKQEFEEFLKISNQFELLTKPGEMIKHPNMRDAVAVKDIEEWDFYPTYEAYIDMMNQFAIDHPELCEVFSIGQSTEGRELMMAKISANVSTREAEPQFLYTGTMHGDETAGYIILLRLIDYLLENYGSDPTIDYLLDNAEIWINPNANPDGTYAGGNNSVNGATRYNANYVDLNRNYPDPEDGPHPDGNEWQPETLAFMQLAEENNFVMSANMHGGAEVLNYPWDTWPRLAADNDWWIYVCREYVDTVHLYSPSNYMTYLNNGITNGYAWYSTSGSRQDYMNYFQQCREVTLELSDTKLLPASQLPEHWDWNYRSLLNYIEQSTFGVQGIITDQETGLPLEAMLSIEGHDMDSSMAFSVAATGFYQRMLDEGTYDLTFSTPGKFPVTIEDVSITRYNTVTVNAQLDAGDLIADFTATATSVSLGSPVSFTDMSYGNPVGWEWSFEGGTPASSNEQNPQGIVWNETGSFDVSLTITDGDGNSEAMLKEDYISVNAEYMMSNQTITTCTGLFYDTGGESGNYGNNEDITMTFLPATAGSAIIISFEMFDVEYNSSCSYDWLKIYDGSSTSAPLIDIYCGIDSPGTIEASNAEGALTFEFHSDYSLTKQGWKALISCTEPPLLPVADFTADTMHIAQGDTIYFTDLSVNDPMSWEWSFPGGTPSSSDEQNPMVIYEEHGTYDVSLTVQNEFGSDTKTIEDFIIVDSTIGIAEMDKDGFVVFPNPVSKDVLNLSSENVIEGYQLFDYTGKRIAWSTQGSNRLKINMSAYNTGLYILKVKIDGHWQSKKVSLVR